MNREPGALEGIRVLDATQVMAGPFCALQLCDMGAEVIKVEPPGGDFTRHLAATGTESVAFHALNRGKKSIVLDLQSPAGVDAFRLLARGADIVLENSRPGAMARLGLDYPTLTRDNPRLIYGSISGYGQTGPRAASGGFDLIAQGESGIMSVTGEPGGAPVKAGVPLTDLAAGLFLLAGLLAALHHRERSGQGQYVDTSLLESGLACSIWETAEYVSQGTVPGPLGSAHRLLAPYQAIGCSDGYLTVGAGSDRLFAQLSAALERRDWPQRPEYATATGRLANRAQLIAEIEEITTAAPRADWLARFEQHGVPCGPINTYAEVLADPQVRARDMVQAIDHPMLGRFDALGSPIKMSATPPDATRRAPLLGEHTREVLLTLDLPPATVASLLAAIR